MPDFTFGPTRRIKHRNDFLRIQSEGKKRRARYFLLAYDTQGKSGAPLSESRLGVTVTKKVDKRAVRRNRLKRRVREFFRQYRARFVQPVDMVVVALRESVDLSYSDIERELSYLLRREQILPSKKWARR